MAQAKFTNSTIAPSGTSNLLIPIIVLWGIVVVAALTYFAYEGNLGGSGTKLYLLPWTFLAGAVISSPAIFLLYKGRLEPFHPLVFPAWSYLLPAFFVGGFLLAFGFVEPYYLAFVEDERYNLPLTLVYITIGYIGLILGYLVPLGRNIGAKVSRWLPVWEWQTEKIVGPGLVLLGLGLANTLLAFTQGILGYQKTEERGIFDGMIFLLSRFWIEASLLLWFYIFRSKNLGTIQFITIAILLVTSLTTSAFHGSRGIFLNTFIMIAFAFILSGKKVTFKAGSIGSVIGFAVIILGTIYGTTFRSIKQDQSAMDIDKYGDVISSTLEQVGSKNLNNNLAFGFVALGERLESVSALAVIVSNYEKLAPFEELYGIDNNIWKDTTIFFIPRIIWPDKPVGIEPSKYADLYFNYSENAFTVTPIGDLLRNFGPIGIPIGMFALGLLLRFMYAALQENQVFSYWRATLYYMLLTAISYEGTYGLILPSLFKVGLTALLGLIIVRFLAGPGRQV